MRLCFQVKDLPYHAGLPMEMAVEKRTAGKMLPEPGDHRESKDAVAGDFLMTAHALGLRPAVTAPQKIKGERLRRIRDPFPGERGMATLLQVIETPSVPDEKIKAWLDA